MLLSDRVRIEVFIPDRPDHSYSGLLERLQSEFTYTFGGCTVISAAGRFLAANGGIVLDKINILFTDIPLEIQKDRLIIVRFTERLRSAVQEALQTEEAVLVSGHAVYHDE
ncbi:MAG: hypothetical protein WAQ99_08180 [Pyrinomonadaceae bacterium]